MNFCVSFRCHIRNTKFPHEFVTIKILTEQPNCFEINIINCVYTHCECLPAGLGGMKWEWMAEVPTKKSRALKSRRLFNRLFDVIIHILIHSFQSFVFKDRADRHTHNTQWKLNTCEKFWIFLPVSLLFRQEKAKCYSFDWVQLKLPIF